MTNNNTKWNIFDHILYEFEMYLYTYDQLHDKSKIIPQNQMNILVESNLIHTRNIIYFFNTPKRKDSDITVKSIIANHNTLFIDKNENCTTIDKAIAHITIERVNGINGESLTERCQNTIEEIYEVIIEKAIAFLELLEDKTNVKEILFPSSTSNNNIHELLDDEEIKNRIIDLLIDLNSRQPKDIDVNDVLLNSTMSAHSDI